MGLFDFLKGKDGKDGKDAAPCIPCKDGVDGKLGGLGFKTILDYGAIMYLSREDAINGKDSSKAIQDMVDDCRVAVLPPYGWFKNEKSTILYKRGQSVISLGQGNRSVNLISTKPIDMFIPVYAHHNIKGFTAWYIGKNITKECAVVRYGGVQLPHGAIYENYNLDHTVKEWKSWKGRTQCFSNYIDFDFEGDINYVKSRVESTPYPYNDTFIENSGAHGVWVDYSSEFEQDYSHFHFTKIRGDWRHINTGLKITRKKGSQSINTIDFKVRINGFRQTLNIEAMSLGRFEVYGQHSDMLNWNKDDPTYQNSNKEDWEEWQVPAFDISGSGCHVDMFNYDRHIEREGVNKLKGNYNINKLDTAGLNNLGGWAGDNIRYIDANFNDSTFINHSVVTSLKKLPKEAIEDLKKQLGI